jgi:hypothetical protein
LILIAVSGTDTPPVVRKMAAKSSGSLASGLNFAAKIKARFSGLLSFQCIGQGYMVSVFPPD